MVDLETAIQRTVGTLLRTEGFVMPVVVSSMAANGGVVCTRFEAPPPGAPKGTATSEHIAGEVPDEGFAAPIHLLVKDATGRVALWRQDAAGDPLRIPLAPEPEPAAATRDDDHER